MQADESDELSVAAYCLRTKPLAIGDRNPRFPDLSFLFDCVARVHAQAPSILQYLQGLPQNVTAVYTDCSTFGTSGLERQPAGSLVIEVHTQRAPYAKFSDDVKAITSAHRGCQQLLTGSKWCDVFE